MNQQTFSHPSAITMSNINSDQQSQSYTSPQAYSNQNSNAQANNIAIHQYTSSAVTSAITNNVTQEPSNLSSSNTINMNLQAFPYLLAINISNTNGN